MQEKRHIAILGSTGSIGTQALNVIREHTDAFAVELLTAHSNAELLIQQALEFRPNAVVIGDESHYTTVSEALWPEGIKAYAGPEALAQAVEAEAIDLVLTALVGFAGLQPTLSAIAAGKQIALANKEAMVVAGELVTKSAREKGVNIFPVGPTHSAIFQCLAGEFHNPIEKVCLTDSGGPFRGKDRAFLETVTKEQALKNPNWDMGAKATVDSASMMSKGLEVIEAMWLFQLKRDQIDVIVHPQSIIHSMVQFQDGSMKAQMGLPDMKLPIQYVLGYPQRLPSSFPRFNFADYAQLTFEPADTETFRNLALAFEALDRGGTMPCILNAANEVVVRAFLEDRMAFLRMPDVIADCMEKVPFTGNPGYEDYVETDRETRRIAQELI